MNGPQVVLAVLLLVVPAGTLVAPAGVPAAASPEPIDADPVRAVDGSSPTSQDGARQLDAGGLDGATRGATTATTVPVVSVPNTTNYLDLAGDVRTTRYGTATIDVGGSWAMDDGRLEGEFLTLRLEEAMRRADSTAGRQRILENASARVEEHIEELAVRERAALDAYNAGEISTRTYLLRLAVIDAEARALRATVARLESFDQAIGDESLLDRQLGQYRAQLLPLTGPVRTDVASALRGEASEPVRVLVATSDDGVALATIQRQPVPIWVRETYVASARDPGAPDTFRTGEESFIEQVDARFGELYPWVTEDENIVRKAVGGNRRLFDVGVYPVAVEHAHGPSRQGDLVVYLDGGTGDVFREFQQKSVTAVPVTTSDANTSEGLRVLVNGTHAGGPAKVRVTDNVTDLPVDAVVEVNGQTLGRTGDDGERWVVASGQRYTVTATRGTRNVTVTVRPPPPTSA